MRMPRIDTNLLSEDAREYARIICKKNGEIRSSKPDPKKSAMHGRAAYIWRHVVFSVSPNPKHQCFPVTADLDLWENDWKNRHQVTKQLDKIVDEIVNAVPVEQWHGVIRWGQAFGVIGRPVVQEDGSIVYR